MYILKISYYSNFSNEFRPLWSAKYKWLWLAKLNAFLIPNYTPETRSIIVKEIQNDKQD
jgi:hypothetical protein